MWLPVRRLLGKRAIVYIGKSKQLLIYSSINKFIKNEINASYNIKKRINDSNGTVIKCI
jgi:hypothetical protein